MGKTSPERLAQIQEWRAKNPKRVQRARRNYILRKYGLTESAAEFLFALVNRRCAICRQRPATDFDHDHKTGAMRLPTCGSCNRGLGLFQDDPQLLRAAAAYLGLFQ